ncbi:putative Ig domain-containing protein [Sphingomonas sp. MMS24-JH45]
MGSSQSTPPAPPHRRLRPFLSPALLAAPRWAPPTLSCPRSPAARGRRPIATAARCSRAAGLSFSTTTGTISGTPTTGSTLSNIAITVTDGTSSATASGLSIVISATITLGNLTLLCSSGGHRIQRHDRR